ncbi:MAG: hypothetical protein ACLS48_09535 [[Eubacterium] siraeum]
MSCRPEEELQPPQLSSERIGSAIEWLKSHGNKKISIVGASTTATVALVAASHLSRYYAYHSPDPERLCMAGLRTGKRDGCGNGLSKTNLSCR